MERVSNVFMSGADDAYFYTPKIVVFSILLARLMGRQIHIPSVKCLRVASFFNERKLRFRRTISTKTFQVSHNKTVSRFVRHPNGSVSRLSTNELHIFSS